MKKEKIPNMQIKNSIDHEVLLCIIYIYTSLFYIYIYKTLNFTHDV